MTQPGSSPAPVLLPGCLSALEQPRLPAAKLILRPWQLSDAAGLVRAYADPEIHRWHARSLTLAEAESWVDHELDRWQEERGGGVATRAVGAVADWAFDAVGFHRLELDHSTQNPASCRVAVKTGFALEGTLRGRALHLDGWHDMHRHGLLAEDARPGKPHP